MKQLLLLPLLIGLASCGSGGPSDVSGTYYGDAQLSTGTTVSLQMTVKDNLGQLSGTVSSITSNFKMSGSRNGGSANLEWNTGPNVWKASGNFSDTAFSGSVKIFNGSNPVGTAQLNLAR